MSAPVRLQADPEQLERIFDIKLDPLAKEPRPPAGLGASSAAAACGLSPWKTPYQLYHELLGLEPKLEIGDDDPLQLEIGLALEPVVIRRFEKRTGLKVTDRQLRVYDPAWPRRWVTVDGISSDGGYVEAKTCGFASPHEWGDEEEDDAVPLHYYMQCQHGMACGGWPHAWMPLIVSNREFRIYRIVRNEEVIAELTEREQEFLARVDAWDPPPVTKPIDIRLRWPAHVENKAVLANMDTAVRLRRHAKVRNAIGKLVKIKDELQFSIQQVMGDASDLVDAATGELLATWKKSRDSQEFDVDELAANEPATYVKYLRSKPGFRRFLNKIK